MKWDETGSPEIPDRGGRHQKSPVLPSAVIPERYVGCYMPLQEKGVHRMSHDCEKMAQVKHYGLSGLPGLMREKISSKGNN